MDTILFMFIGVIIVGVLLFVVLAARGGASDRARTDPRRWQENDVAGPSHDAEPGWALGDGGWRTRTRSGAADDNRDGADGYEANERERRRRDDEELLRLQSEREAADERARADRERAAEQERLAQSQTHAEQIERDRRERAERDAREREEWERHTREREEWERRRDDDRGWDLER